MKYQIRKYIFLILALTSFFYIDCPGQEAKKKSNDSVEIWINEIKKEYANINNDTAKLRIVQEDIFSQTTEGGFSRKFYDGTTLRKAIFTFFGETGQSTDECYLLNGEIIFVYQRLVLYKSPIYMGKTEIKNREENRYYFKNQKLIQWIGPDNVVVNEGLYPEKENEILADIKNIH